MNKRIIVILTVCFLLTPISIAYADVIIHAAENRFYSQHKDECVLINRGFYVKSESGFVSIKSEPGSEVDIAVIENNEVRYVKCTYDFKGETWGFIEQLFGKRWINGWVPMKQLLLNYDSISFTEEYKNEIYPYTGNYDEKIKTTEHLVFWSWPGSGIIGSGIAEMSTKGCRGFGDRILPYISQTYSDKQGREWGLVKRAFFDDTFPHWWGNTPLDAWICLSDPSNEAIPAFNPPRPTPWAPAETISGDPDSNDASVGADLRVYPDINQTIYSTDDFIYENVAEFGKSAQGEHIGSPLPGQSNTAKYRPSAPLLIVILVILLVASTAILIRIFWRPTNKM